MAVIELYLFIQQLNRFYIFIIYFLVEFGENMFAKSRSLWLGFNTHELMTNMIFLFYYLPTHDSQPFCEVV